MSQLMSRPSASTVTSRPSSTVGGRMSSCTCSASAVTGGLVVDGDAARQCHRRHGPVHHAGVEIEVAQFLGQQPPTVLLPEAEGPSIAIVVGHQAYCSSFLCSGMAGGRRRECSLTQCRAPRRRSDRATCRAADRPDAAVPGRCGSPAGPGGPAGRPSPQLALAPLAQRDLEPTRSGRVGAGGCTCRALPGASSREPRSAALLQQQPPGPARSGHRPASRRAASGEPCAGSATPPPTR